MGRKAGGRNYENISAERRGVELPQNEIDKLPSIFTSINKDFISVADMIEVSGLSYDTCTKIIRQIKSISDIFGIAGHVHRTDYYAFIVRQFSARVQEGA